MNQNSIVGVRLTGAVYLDVVIVLVTFIFTMILTTIRHESLSLANLLSVNLSDYSRPICQ
jgi:hypothetical protein